MADPVPGAPPDNTPSLGEAALMTGGIRATSTDVQAGTGLTEAGRQVGEVAPGINDQSLPKMFAGLDKMGDALPLEQKQRMDQLLATSSDPDADKAEWATAAYLAHSFRKPITEITPVLDSYRHNYVQQMGWDQSAGDDNKSFYNRVQQHFETRKLETGLLGEAQGRLYDEFKAGETNWKIPFTAALADMKGKPGYDPGRLDIYRHVAEQQWNDWQAAGEHYPAAVATIGKYLAAYRSGQGNEDEQVALREQALRALGTLPEGDVGNVLGLAAREMAKAAPSGETGGEKIPGRLERGVGEFATQAGRGMGDLLMGGSDLPKDQVNSLDEMAWKSRSVERRLDAIAQGAMDPLHGDGRFNEALLRTAEGLPQMMAAFSGPGLAANLLAFSEEGRTHFEDAGVPPREAQLLGLAAAVPLTALMRVNSTTLMGQGAGRALTGWMASNLKPDGLVGQSLFKGYVKNMLATGAIDAATYTGVAAGMQLTDPALQSLAGLMDKTIPQVQWSGKDGEWSKLAKSTPETLVSLAPLILLGSGMGILRDRAFVDQNLRDIDKLRAVGIPDDIAGQIRDAKTPEIAQRLLQDNWDKREPNPAAIQKLNAKTTSESAGVAGPAAPPAAVTPTIYRGANFPEGGRQDFPGKFYSLDKDTAAGHGAHITQRDLPANLLKSGTPEAKQAVDEFLKANPEHLATGEENPGDHLMMFPDQNWVDFIRSKGYTGTQLGRDVFITDETQAVGGPPVETDPAKITADRTEYDRLQVAMKQEKPLSPEYKALWQQSEDIKNRHGGLVPEPALQTPPPKPGSVIIAPAHKVSLNPDGTYTIKGPKGNPVDHASSPEMAARALLSEKARMRQEELASNGAPEKRMELAQWIRGKLPHPEGYTGVLAGEIRDLHAGLAKLVKVERALKNEKTVGGAPRKGYTFRSVAAANAFFGKRGVDVDLDRLTEAAREAGFDVNTPAELLEAVDNSLRGIPTYAWPIEQIQTEGAMGESPQSRYGMVPAERLVPGAKYWLDPKGKFHETGDHEDFAAQKILKDQNLSYNSDSGDWMNPDQAKWDWTDISREANKRGWIRVVSDTTNAVGHKQLFLTKGEANAPVDLTKAQRNALEDHSFDGWDVVADLGKAGEKYLFDASGPATAVAEGKQASYAPGAAFYSRLVRTVEESPQGKASGAQWKAMIRNSKLGVNQDEYSLVGVDDLEDGKSYTKREVLDFLKANQVEVKDVTLGVPKQIEPVKPFVAPELLTKLPEGYEPILDRNAPEGRQWGITPPGQGHARFWEGAHPTQEAATANALDRVNMERRRDAERKWEDSNKPARPETHFGDYQLPGAKEGSYREVLLTVPTSTPGLQPNERPHWQVADDIFQLVPSQYTRGIDQLRRETMGQKLDTIETAEAQNAISAVEAKPGGKALIDEYVRALLDQNNMSRTWRDGHSQYAGISNPIVRLRYNERATADGKRMLFLEEVQPPQKGEFSKMPALFQKNWREIAFKYALRKAVEEGFDSIGWTTGEQQAERYDLSKQVDKLVVSLGADDKTYHVLGEKDGRRVVSKSLDSLDELDGVIGPDLAQKAREKLAEFEKSDNPARFAIAQDPNNSQNWGIIWETSGTEGGFTSEQSAREAGVKQGGGEATADLFGGASFTGENLKVGGEGLKKLYDQDFRNVVNSLPVVKKAGQKATTEDVGTGQRTEFKGEMSYADLRNKFNEYEDAWEGPHKTVAGWRNWNVTFHAQAVDVLDAMKDGGMSYADAMRQFGSEGLAQKLGAGEFSESQKKEPVHSLTINPEMRAPVLAGQNLAEKKQPAYNKPPEPALPAPISHAERVENFKKWFGDSKVVDAAGNPLVVYHGTNPWPKGGEGSLGDFEAFDRLAVSKARGMNPYPNFNAIGSWFSSKPDARGAQLYGKTIYPVYLSIQNPKTMSFNQFLGEGKKLGGWKPGTPDGLFNPDPLREKLKAQGFDGIKFPEAERIDGGSQDVFVAFEPTQIKSAIGNRGTYDPSNPSIIAEPNQFDIPPRIPDAPTRALAQKYVAKVGTPKALEESARDSIAKVLAAGQGEFDLPYQAPPVSPIDRLVADDQRAGAVRALTQPAVQHPTQDELAGQLKAGFGEGNRISSIIPELVRDPRKGWDIRGAVVKSPKDLAMLAQAMRSPFVESMKVAFLDQRDRVIHSEIMSIGSITASLASPDLLSRAAQNAGPVDGPRRVIISHNHPSGDPAPSAADVQVTRQLREYCQALGWQLVDHVITNGDTYYSFQEAGLMGQERPKGILSGGKVPMGADAALGKPLGEKAMWEVVKRGELRKVDTSEESMRLFSALKQVDPTALHIIFLNRKNRMTGLQRVSGFAAAPDQFLKGVRAINTGAAQEGATAFLLVLPDGMTAERESLFVRTVGKFSRDTGLAFHDAMAPALGGERSLQSQGLMPHSGDLISSMTGMREGPRQEDMFEGGAETGSTDFTLSGEQATDSSGIMDQKEAAAEAKRKAEADQMDMFGGGVQEPPQPFGTTPAPKPKSLMDAVARRTSDIVTGVKQLIRETAKVPEFEGFHKVLNRWVGDRQLAEMHTLADVKKVIKALPKKIDRIAMANWLAAGGDRTKLQFWAEHSPDAGLRVGYEAALKLTPEQLKISGWIREWYNTRFERAEQNNLIEKDRFLKDYVTQMVERPVSRAMEQVSFSGDLSKNFKYSRERTFPDFFELERAGFNVRTKDVAEIMAGYDHELNKAILTRQLARNLLTAKNSNGDPLGVPIKGQLAAGEGTDPNFISNPKLRQVDQKQGEIDRLRARIAALHDEFQQVETGKAPEDTDAAKRGQLIMEYNALTSAIDRAAKEGKGARLKGLQAKRSEIRMTLENEHPGWRQLHPEQVNGIRKVAPEEPGGQKTPKEIQRRFDLAGEIRDLQEQIKEMEQNKSDEDAITYEPINHPAFQKWWWIGKDPREGGKDVYMQGEIGLHPDIRKPIMNAIGRSALREWMDAPAQTIAQGLGKDAARLLDKSNSFLKQSMLGGISTFHAVHEIKRGAASGVIVNPFKLAPLDPENDQVKAAVRYGLMLMQERGAANEFSEGLGEKGGLVGMVPVLKDVSKAVSDLTFHRLIPGLKMKMFTAHFERNLKLFAPELAAKKVTRDDIGYLTAGQVNARFGHLNMADLNRNPTFQHILSLSLLAPDFWEANFRNYGQAVKGMTGMKVGRQPAIAFIITAGVVMLVAKVLTSALNDDGDPHWSDPFSVIAGGRRYTMRNEAADLFNMLTKTPEYVSGRLSPMLSSLDEWRTKRNWRGEKVDTKDVMEEFLAKIIPISARWVPGIRQLIQASATGGGRTVTPWQEFLTSQGVQISRHSPLADAYDLANKWMKDQGDKEDRGTYPVSKYSQLRYALEDGDMARAREEWDKLVKDAKGHNEALVNQGLHSSIFHPWTTTRARDQEFKASLNDVDRVKMEHAEAWRAELWKRYMAMERPFVPQ